jgi:hypothetical protein
MSTGSNVQATHSKNAVRRRLFDIEVLGAPGVWWQGK